MVQLLGNENSVLPQLQWKWQIAKGFWQVLRVQQDSVNPVLVTLVPPKNMAKARDWVCPTGPITPTHWSDWLCWALFRHHSSKPRSLQQWRGDTQHRLEMRPWGMTTEDQGSDPRVSETSMNKLPPMTQGHLWRPLVSTGFHSSLWGKGSIGWTLLRPSWILQGSKRPRSNYGWLIQDLQRSPWT